MADVKEIEIWIAMDSDGDIGISSIDQTSAVDDYCNQIGGSLPLRVVKVTVSMCPPAEVDAEASVVVPDSAGEVVTATA